jgi:hypothetical protein
MSVIFSINLRFQNFSNTQLAYLMNSSFRKAVILVWISERIIYGTVTLRGIFQLFLLDFGLVLCHLLKGNISSYVGLKEGTNVSHKISFQICGNKFVALSSSHLKKS